MRLVNCLMCSMKILHVTQEMFKTSGVATFCKEVSAEQVRAGHSVFALVNHDYDLKFDKQVRVVVGRSIDEMGVVPDVVHIHGLWAPFSGRAMAWCRHHDVRYVISTHGCLMERVFKKGWIKKHLFWWLVLRYGVKRASLFHFTAEAERDAVSRFGFNVPSIVAPLGVRIPTSQSWHCAHSSSHSQFRTCLFLGRISDEKGLSQLLDAWKELDAANWRLVIAGPDWRGYRARLVAKVKNEEIRRVEFCGPVFGTEKEALYRQSDLFVLASPVENFSAVVLDALAYGIPVICTKGTPWGCVEREKCGWWIEPNSSAAIKDALQCATSLPIKELKGMGMRGIAVAKRNFSWESVADRLVRGYKGVV